MEKANNVYVRRGEFGWSDVGTWGSLYQHARKDRYANAKPEKDVIRTKIPAVASSPSRKAK